LITSLTLPAPIDFDGCGEGEGGFNIYDRFNPRMLYRVIIRNPFRAGTEISIVTEKRSIIDLT
jgi:hypothetical protein